MRKDDARLFFVVVSAFLISVLSAWCVFGSRRSESTVLYLLCFLAMAAGLPGLIVGMFAGFVIGGFNVHDFNEPVIPIVAVISNTWLYSWIFSKLKLREGSLIQKRH